MKIRALLAAPAMLLTLAVASPAVAAYDYPSTNDENRVNGDQHVNFVSATFDTITLEFVNPRPFVECFEYRTDGDESQATGAPNFNQDVEDGLYPFLCLTNSSTERTFEVERFIEVRSAFGAERDNDFPFTRFDANQPASKDDCKNGGFEQFGFKNQGQCVSFTQGRGGNDGAPAAS